ncbi:MAG: tRNA pseudouridine(38-40) synthase TruA [Actinomycetota bacterium]|nr:tRNA pseudouridine(38-40) synthase TruA [Actinomycetota bacterium]
MREDLTLFDEIDLDPGPTKRIRLDISYDGTGFRGLAPNTGVRTVVGELQRVLAPFLGMVPDIVMSGRTDAGVHSSGQVLSFDAPERTADPERIGRIVTSRLGPEIVARQCSVVPDTFSARFSATGRRYRYTVLNLAVPDPFLARTAWWVPEPLDLGAMRLACDPLIGEHDYSSFCRRPKSVDGSEVSLVRRVNSARWDALGGGILLFEIAGPAFCHQMVRSIVGFHVAVGRGRRSAGELLGVLTARNRNAAENPAPPHGLNLCEVQYEEPIPGWSA